MEIGMGMEMGIIMKRLLDENHSTVRHHGDDNFSPSHISCEIETCRGDDVCFFFCFWDLEMGID